LKCRFALDGSNGVGIVLFTSLNGYVEPVLWRCERAVPAGVIRTRWIIRIVKIDNDGFSHTSQIRSLDHIEEIATPTVRFFPVRSIPEGQKDPTPIAQYPVQT
jgi:hypothetical protein